MSDETPAPDQTDTTIQKADTVVIKDTQIAVTKIEAFALVHPKITAAIIFFILGFVFGKLL
jgi:aspartate carbamoyltransferase regulatory subunit